MALTYKDIKERTLKILDEYDTDGNISTTGDVLTKIKDFVNDAMMDLASSTAKIHGEYYIDHSPVYNDLSRDTSSIKTFLPGGADISVSLLNAQSCYFEITGPATVVIEETSDGVNYSTLQTISVSSSVTNFTDYRRLITPSLATKTVRLRFTGPYIFRVRNYILYPYSWPVEADIQSHKPFFEYDLPSDFLDLSQVMVKKDVRQYIAYTTHILRPDKKIAFNRYDAPSEFIIHYWRSPTLFTYTGVDATDDAQVFDIDTVNGTYRVSNDSALVIPFYAAGQVLLSSGNSGISSGLTLMNIYETKKANLITNKIGYQGTVINLFGW